MADQYDGSVRINTELDTSGFVGGTEELTKSLERIEQSINRLGAIAAGVFQQLSKTKIGAPQVPTREEMQVPPPEMDTRDLDRQTRRVRDDMNSVRDSMRQQGTPPDSPHVDTTQLDSDARRVRGDMQDVHDAMRMRPDDERLEPRVETDRLNEDAGRVQSAMQYIRSALRRQPDKPEEPRIETEPLDQDAQRVQDDMRNAREALETDLPTPTAEMPESTEFDREADRIQSALNRITGEVDRMISSSAQGFRTTSAVLAFSDRLDVAAERIEDARQALDDFAKTQIPTDQYRETTDAIERAERALLKLYDRRDMAEDTGVEEGSRQWQRLELQIRNAEEELERYEADADRMRETGLAFVDTEATSQYRDMVDQLHEAEDAYETNVGLIQQAEIEQAQMNVLAAQEAVANAGTNAERQQAMRDLQEAQNQLAAIAQQSVTPAPDPAVQSRWDAFKEGLKELGAAAVNVTAKLGPAAWSGVKITLKSVTHTIQTMGRAVLTVSKAVGTVTTGLTKMFLHVGKSGNAVEELARKLSGIKRMLVSRLKRTFISYLFQQITGAIKELAKFDARFDQSISNMRNRAKELSANVVSAVGGLFRQIEPYITRLIDALSQGVVKTSAVLAALRGEDYVVVATRQTESYAASLDQATTSANQAREAQEKLNRALTSFDEIHKLNADDADVVAVDDAENQTTPLYQNVPVQAVFSGIDEAVRDAVDRLIAAVRAGDWYGAGAAVADGLNYVVNQIDEVIESIHDRAVAVAHNVAEALNGLVDNFDAYALGETIADALNLALDVAYEFLTTFNFERFGQRIGEAITGFLSNLDAEGLGRTIAAWLNAAVDFAYGIIMHTNFALLGQRFAEALNGLADEFDFEHLGETVARAINGAFTFAYNALTTFDFSGLGRSLAAALNSFTDTFDTATVGQSIVAAINGVINFAYEAITGYDWERLGEKLGDLFNELFGGDYRISEQTTRRVGGEAREQYLNAMGYSVRGIDWAKIARLLAEGLVDVLNGFAAFIETADWEAVGETITEILSEVDWGAIANAMVRLLGAALGGLAGLIKGALGFDTDTSDIIDEFSLDPRRGLRPQGDAGGFDDGDGNHISYVYGAANLDTDASGYQSKIQQIAEAIKTGLMRSIGAAFQAAHGEITEAGQNVGSGMMTGIADYFQQAEQLVKDNMMTPFIKGVKKAFDIASPSKKMKPYGGYIAEGVLAGIKDAFAASTIKPWVEANVRDPLLEAFNAAFNVSGGVAQAMEVCGHMIADGIKAGISAGWTFITNLLTGYAAAIRAIFPLADFIQTGLDIISGIGQGLSNPGQLANNITNRAKAVADIIKGQLAGFINAGLGILADLGLGLGNESSIAQNITAKASGIADKIKGAFTGFVERGQQIVAEIASGLTGNQTGVDAPSTGIASRIKNAFTGFVEKGKAILADLGEGLGDQNEQSNSVIAPSTSIAARIKGAFTGFVQKGKDIVTDLGTGLKDQSNWDQNVGGPATTRAGWIRGAFDGFIQKGKDIISQLGTGLTDQGNWNQNVGGPAITRASWIKGAFTGFVQKGKDIISELGGGISDLGTWNNTVGGTVLERVGWIVNGLRSGNYYDAGRYIVQGLDRGIQDQYAESRRIAESLGGVVLDAFNRAMGIGSPSRVMAEAGGYVVEGLAMGIEGESRRAYNSMRSVAAGLIAETDDMSVTPEVDVAARGLDTVADKLAIIADIFDSIKQTLLSLPTFQIPAVAAGTIAPAQTRVTTSAGRSDLAEMKAMLAQFLTRVTELEEAAAGRPIRLESTVKIDEREIGRAVEDYNRSNNNITNGGGGWR